MNRPHMGYHRECSVDACVVGKVTDPTVYATKHSNVTKPPCDGTCSRIEPAQVPILNILQRGGIPIIQASLSHDALKVDIIEYQTGMEYIAISHVWSDGLGNETHSWLPKCQFVHLIQAVEATRKADDESAVAPTENDSGTITVRFWIDTICVPRGDANLEFRWKALDLMADTYRHSSMVLVLDAELYQTKPETSLQAIMLLNCSNWMRRLWTLQEGILGGQRLYILFKGRTLHLWSELEKLRQQQRTEPWRCDPLIPFILRTGLQTSIRASPSDKLSWLFRDMNWRSTTRKTDEALVLSTLLNVIPPNMNQIPAEDRLMAVIAELDEFPRRVIFAPGPRFEKEGYGWALRSFLRRTDFSLGTSFAKLQKIRDQHSGAKVLGLKLSYPGYILRRTLELNRRPWDFVLLDSQHDKVLHIKEVVSRQEFVEEVEGNDDGGPAVMLGLIIHKPVFNRIHAYGAVVGLDAESSAELSAAAGFLGVHHGSVDVFIYARGENLAIEERGKDGVELAYNYSDTEKTWIIQ
ncbi:hypothetical protein LZ30DRAFT_717905 [Colletotrichum cereale]|nr:hypothetical protein LZ30DRAFT_717905 [Colletotrichum cereale]